MSARTILRSRLSGVLVATLTLSAMATGLATSAATADDSRPTDLTSTAAAQSLLGELHQRLRQPDGSSFRADLTADEVGGLFETEDGYSVAKSAEGAWVYVTGRDDAGDALLSDAVVGSDPVPAGVRPGAGRATTEVSAKVASARAEVQRQLQIMAREAQLAASRAGEPRVFKVPALMLATWYDESAGETMPQFHDGRDAAYFTKLLDGFGGNPRGSMTQFYYEASFGQFMVEVDVFGAYTSLQSIADPCHYGDGNGETKLTDPAGSALGLGGLGALGMAVEAVPQANVDPAMSWGDYDNDGDGKVDFTMIIHSGGDHAVTGNDCFTHSHAIQATLGLGETAESTLGLPYGTISRVGIPTSTPGVFVDRVVTIPEYGSQTDPLTIGVAAHEMGHAIGEPDYYDTGYTSTGTGDFDMMSGGSYLGSPSGSNPSMMSPATRVFQGWVTPKVVTGDLQGYTLKPRTVLPSKGYTVDKVDPNLLLVPTYEIALGETDGLGHVWTEADVYGLPVNPRTKKFIVEGYYVENVSRNAASVKLNKKNPMGAMFDRRMHGSGLMVWHFDYWRQSTTYFGHGNDAQSDPNRYQMDVEEFDRNDNTQDLQLNYSRGNPSDLLTAAATGITSGTHLLPPGVKSGGSKPQKPIELSGTVTPVTPTEIPFEVDPKADNVSMTVSVGSENLGDCALTLVDPSGQATDEADSGSFGDQESISIPKPAAGTWTASVRDFAACGQFTGRVVFTGGASAFVTSGSADTWSNWSQKPTGWAFTNIQGYGNGIDMSHEAGGSGNITLDVLNLAGRTDVSPGFVTGKLSKTQGWVGLNAGRTGTLQVPVFSNGSNAPGAVTVTVRRDSATGPVVATKQVTLGAYQRKYVTFPFRPAAAGTVRLVTTVDPANRIREASERNQVQVTDVQVGPAAPKVLVVDDDQSLAHEQAVVGALSALGIGWTLADSHVTAAQMKPYQAVIWESSVDRYEGQLSNADVKQVRTYLKGGGRFLLTSNRGFDGLAGLASPQSTPAEVRFAAEYLGFRIPTGATSYVVSQGAPGSVATSGVLGKGSVAIGPPAGRPFLTLAGLADKGTGATSETIAPLGKASGIGRLDKKSMTGVADTAEDPAYIGFSVDGTAKAGGFRTVSLGWNLGSNRDAGATVRLLGSVMRHFGVKPGAARAGARPLVYLTPVRDGVSGQAVPITAVVVANGAPRVTLQFRRHARGGFYSVVMRRTGPSTYVGTIPGNAVTPDGVDYFVQAGDVRSISDPRGPLYHSMGVATPIVKNPIRIK